MKISEFISLLSKYDGNMELCIVNEIDHPIRQHLEPVQIKEVLDNPDKLYLLVEDCNNRIKGKQKDG